MTIPKNPYIAGNPVGGTEAFIGRSDVLRDVKGVLRNPNHNAIVLYGQRRIGKTSLLQELKAQLARENAYFPVYMELQDKAAWSLEKLLRALAQEISAALHTKVPLPESGDVPVAFREAYIPQVLAELPDGASIVLLFDEFDVLDNPEQGQAGAAFFPYLRTFLEARGGRLQFVFVIGRKPEDLSNLTLSVFKGIRSKRVSLLSKEDTRALVRLSERNHTLVWSEEALQAVWDLTHGHPFLTQQLCEIIWENAYEVVEGDASPTVEAEAVQAAVPETLESSANALQWLWDGLPAAEKYVAAVLAEAGPQPVGQDELLRRLNESGVRIVIHKLQDAPQILKDWDLLEETPGGYCFRVELLRRWIAEKKPVPQVYQELENIEPLAQALYEAGQRYYQLGQFKQATGQLRQALEINPNHAHAGLLLAQILLARGAVNEAIALLEKIYAYNPGLVRPRLVQALLRQAEATKDEEARLERYMRILEISPGQREAVANGREILEGGADRAIQAGNPTQALELYWQLAINEHLTDGFRDEDVARLKAKQQFASHCMRVQKSLAANRFEEAQKWLQELLGLKSEYAVLEPGFKQILEDLLEIVRHRKTCALCHLSSWNPLDALRLLWWLLVRPQTLKRCRVAWGEQDITEVGIRLASFLTWGPLLIVTLAIVLNTLPLPSGTPPTIFYWISTGILGLAILLTGVRGANSVLDDMASSLAIGATGGWAMVMEVSLVVIVAFGMGSNAVISMAVVMASVIAFIVALNEILDVVLDMAFDGVSSGRVFSMVIGMAGVVALVVVVGVVYALVSGVASVPVIEGLIWCLGISYFFVMALVLWDVVQNNVQTGRLHWKSLTVFGALVAAYAFLIWFSFFGGWRFFQATGG